MLPFQKRRIIFLVGECNFQLNEKGSDPFNPIRHGSFTIRDFEFSQYFHDFRDNPPSLPSAPRRHPPTKNNPWFVGAMKHLPLSLFVALRARPELEHNSENRITLIIAHITIYDLYLMEIIYTWCCNYSLPRK